MYTVVIPVYRNAEFLKPLIEVLESVAAAIKSEFQMETEVVFVVDGSPDDSYARLVAALPHVPFRSQVVLHARNFGSFAAIRTGLAAGRGCYFGVVAADLQEPPELLLHFLREMTADEADIVVGVRQARADPGLTQVTSQIFWTIYRRIVMPEMPPGGVDVFGCTGQVRDEILRLDERHSSLIGLVFWMGFRRIEVPYERRARQFGKSAWTFRKKFDYMMDSVFAFTNIPIRIITLIGLLGVSVATAYGTLIILLRVFMGMPIPGYAATVVLVSFFGGMNTLALGIIGSYTWRAYENTKRRPLSIVRRIDSFPGLSTAAPDRS